jgi:hypothetical protein
VNQDYEAVWRNRPTSLIRSDPFNGMDLFGVVSPAESYSAMSLEAALPQATLRSSIGPYPPSTARFLALPDSVPERVLSLARDLTANASTPYDRAQAIETYLRTSYPYTLDVPAPPVGRDVADFFLFDLKKGYCDYYATAMVVLARAAGLPARFVSGFSSGTYDSSNAQYIVTEANAHSWVEIFFTDVGWVEFEPTAGLPAIDRQDEPLIQHTDSFPLEQNEVSTEMESTNILLDYFSKIGIGILFLGIISFFTLWLESLTLFLQPVPVSITQMFKRMEKLGSRLTGKGTGETPFEYSNRLKARMDSNRPQKGSVLVVSPASSEINAISESYVLSAYSQHTVQRKHAYSVIHSWRRLRLRLVVEIFRSSIGIRKGST